MSPCLLNFYVVYIMQGARLDETQAGIKTAKRNINNPRYADDIILMAESKEELKILLMKVKQQSEIWFKIKHLKMKEGGGFRMGNTCIPVADSF